jgi:hypothetical protein
MDDTEDHPICKLAGVLHSLRQVQEALLCGATVEGNGIHATQVSNQDTAVLLHYP